MKLITTVLARVLFSLPIAIFGIFHFMDAEGMAEMVPSWIPGGVFWVYLTGLALIVAAVSIISNKKAKLASLLLAALLFIFVLLIWIPQLGSYHEQEAMTAMSMLLKDIGLIGGALIIAGIAQD